MNRRIYKIGDKCIINDVSGQKEGEIIAFIANNNKLTDTRFIGEEHVVCKTKDDFFGKNFVLCKFEFYCEFYNSRCVTKTLLIPIVYGDSVEEIKISRARINIANQNNKN